MPNSKIALIGGGPACLIAAYFLADHFNVTLYEAGKTIGRKFLVAGKGGFNLTNAARGKELTAVYSDHEIIRKALLQFDSQAAQNWLNSLGIETYTGSSGRIFPTKGIKPAEVLAAIKHKLVEKRVEIIVNSPFVGFGKTHKPLIKSDKITVEIEADHVIFGLGGGSWKKTGANEKWLTYFHAIGVKTVPFQASNCGVITDLPPEFLENFQGKPLKNIGLKIADIYLKGEALITAYGLEGNCIYPAIPGIREKLNHTEGALIYIDLKPHNELEHWLEKAKKPNLKPKDYRTVFNLDNAAFQLLKSTLTKEEFMNPAQVAEQLKNVPIRIKSLRSIDEAISTVGGIPLDEVNSDFSLKKYAHITVIGEMLDWDAPTGGFLLQGCFSTGYFAAQALIKTIN